MCNLYRSNGIHCDRQSFELDNESFDSTSSLINRLFQKGHKKVFAKCFASFETANRINRPKANNNSLDSVVSRPLVHQQTAQTCQRRSQKQTLTTNQSHVETRTSTTKTPAPNCNYEQQRKTYIGNDDKHDCINNIGANQIEWYIELASNCYRNGFQLHVNHLDECSKHPSVIQKKPVQAAVLRLPSLALLCHPLQRSVQSERSERNVLNAGAVSFVPDLVVSPSFESIAFSAHCDQYHSRDLYSDEKKCQRHHQLNIDKINRIYSKTHLSPNLEASQRSNKHRPIDNRATLATIDTTTSIKRQPTETEQLNVLNAKNNMNSVAVDANTEQNLQLSCQAIQYNYHNNNLTFYQEFEAGGEQKQRTIAENNNYQQHWIGEKQHLTPFGDASSEERSIATVNQDIVNELIETFNSSFDVSDVKQIKLPQIILSDFSSDQPTPPTTPLFFDVQSTARTLSEHPTQLQEYQPTKPLHLSTN